MRHSAHLKNWTGTKKPCGELVHKPLRFTAIATSHQQRLSPKCDVRRLTQRTHSTINVQHLSGYPIVL